MSKTPIREDRNANKLESNNELTHTTNQNCTLPSSGEEEQKRSLIEGRRVERYALAQALEWGGRWT